jgi:hypothetical protein
MFRQESVVAMLRLCFSTLGYGLAQKPSIFSCVQSTGPDSTETELNHMESLVKVSLDCI